MQKPESLKEYLQRISLQRRKEYFLLNENKNIPNPISLDKDNKIDQLILEIINYVKHLIGEGPLFGKFQSMMQHLHKVFMRQLSEFHTVGLYTKINNDQKYIDQIKKANQTLTNYVEKCQQDQEEASKKLQKLMEQNKYIRAESVGNMKKSHKPVEIEDKFDVNPQPNQPVKAQKLNRIDFGSLLDQKGTSNPKSKTAT